MTSKFFKTVKKFMASGKAIPKPEVDMLTSIATDLRSKEVEAQQHREKVKDEINKGTKITKRRIPL